MPNTFDYLTVAPVKEASTEEASFAALDAIKKQDEVAPYANDVSGVVVEPLKDKLRGTAAILDTTIVGSAKSLFGKMDLGLVSTFMPPAYSEENIQKQEDLLFGLGSQFHKLINETEAKPTFVPATWIAKAREIQENVNVFDEKLVGVQEHGEAVLDATLSNSGFALLSRGGVVGSLLIGDTMFNEQVNADKNAFTANNLPHQTEDYLLGTVSSAAINTAIEKVQQSVIGKTLFGKNLATMSSKYLLRMSLKGVGGAATAYAAKTFAAVLQSGVEEYSQSMVTDWYTNMHLITGAEKAKRPVLETQEQIDAVEKQYSQGQITKEEHAKYVRLLPLETRMERAKQGFQAGVTMMVAPVGIGAYGNFKTAKNQVALGEELRVSEGIEGNYVKDITDKVESHLLLSDQEQQDAIAKELETASADSLFTVVKKMGMNMAEIPAGVSAREAMVQYVKENKVRLPQYREILMTGFLGKLEKDDSLSLASKQIAKWMIQGSGNGGIDRKDIPMLFMVMNGIAKNAGYDNTVDWLNQESALTEQDTTAIFDQIVGMRRQTELGQRLEMESKNLSKEELYTKYGGWKGRDGKWRVEIDPDAFVLQVGDKPITEKRTLGEIVENIPLFELYPELRNLKVFYNPKVDGAALDMMIFKNPEQGNSIDRFIRSSSIEIGTLHGLDLEKLRNSLTHETQHAVGEIEKFQYGDLEVLTKMDDAKGRKEYLKLPGEIEARLTERRGLMSKEQRAAEPIWITEANMLKEEGISFEQRIPLPKSVENFLDETEFQTKDPSLEGVKAGLERVLDTRNVGNVELGEIKQLLEKAEVKVPMKDLQTAYQNAVAVRTARQLEVDRQRDNVMAPVARQMGLPFPDVTFNQSSSKYSHLLDSPSKGETYISFNDSNGPILFEQYMPELKTEIITVNGQSRIQYTFSDGTKYIASEKETKENISLDKDLEKVTKYAAIGLIQYLSRIKKTKSYADIHTELTKRLSSSNKRTDTFVETQYAREVLNQLENAKVALVEKTANQTFYQTEASEVRGQTRFLADGKFVIDLFQGGDIITLAHEFAHAISPVLPQNVIDLFITDFVRQKFAPTLDPDSQDDFIEKTKRAWLQFVDMDFTGKMKNPTGEYRTLLTGAQEYLAMSFQEYLTQDTIPTGMKKLAPAFNLFKENYKKNYLELRMANEHLNPRISAVFDMLITKEGISDERINFLTEMKDLPKREVTIGGTKYTLYESKPNNAARAKILKALQKAYVDIDGLKAQVQDYLDTVLNKKQKNSAEIKLAVEKMASNADAFKVLDQADLLIWAEQNKRRKQLIKNIVDTFSNVNMSKLSRDAQKELQDAIKNIDIHKPQAATMKELRHLADFLDREIRKEAPNAKLSDLMFAPVESIKRLSQISLWNMSLTDLQELYDVLEEVSDMDEAKQNKRMALFLGKQATLKGELDRQLNESRRVKKGKTKDKNLRELRMEKKHGAIYKTLRERKLLANNTIRMLRASHIPALEQLAEELYQGAIREETIHESYMIQLERIVSPTLFQETSDRSKMIPIPMLQEIDSRERNIPKEELQRLGKKGQERYYKNGQLYITKSELMMLYGYTFNEHAFKAVLQGGLSSPENPAINYKFNTNQAGTDILTLCDKHLTQEERNAVHQIIQFYSGVSDQLNTLSTKIFGRKIATETNYLPLFREWLSRENMIGLSQDNLLVGARQFARHFATSAGLLKARINSTQPVWLTDIYEGIALNLKETSFILGMAEPLMVAQNIILGDKGTQGVYTKLTSLFGEGKMKYLETWIKDNMDRSNPPVNQVALYLGRANRATKSGIMKWRLLSAFKQDLTKPLYLNYGISSANYTKVLLDHAQDPSALLGFLPKYNMEQLGAMHPVFRARYRNALDVDLRDDYRVASAKNFFGKKVYGGQRGFLPMTWRDSAAASFALECVEKQYPDMPQKEQIALALRMHLNTQATFHPALSSNFMASREPLFRATYGAFQSQLDALRGEMQENLDHVMNDIKEGTVGKQTWIHAENYFRTLFVTAFNEQAFTEAWNILLRGKTPPEDPEEYGKWFNKMIHRFVSNMISIRAFDGRIAAAAYNKLVGQYGSVPNMTLIEYWISSMGSAANISYLWREGKPKQEEKWEELGAEAVIDTILKLCTLNGFGAENIYNQIKDFFFREEENTKGKK